MSFWKGFLLGAAVIYFAPKVLAAPKLEAYRPRRRLRIRDLVPEDALDGYNNDPEDALDG